MKTLLSILLLSNSFCIAKAKTITCQSEVPVTCYPDSCCHIHCLGPDNLQGNEQVRPFCCHGDWEITVAGLYWQATQDGLEYAIDNATSLIYPDLASEKRLSTPIVDSQYASPHFQWKPGAKLGLSYYSPCDGWDISLLWTWFQGKANSHIETEFDDNHVLVTLWSAFSSVWAAFPPDPLARDISTDWKVDLNLIDLSLGRNYWVSKYLSIRPHIGICLSYIEQTFQLGLKGISWGFEPPQPALFGKIKMDNDFKGAGACAGLDLNWHLGCGWSLFSESSTGIIYGRFAIKHKETAKEAASPFDQTLIYQSKENMRVSRAMLHYVLGIQWASFFCDCDYDFSVKLGWEQNLFFHQNQLWRVARKGRNAASAIYPNPRGQNVYSQSRGTLFAGGLTVTAQLAF